MTFSPDIDLTSAGGVSFDLPSSQQEANAICNKLQTTVKQLSEENEKLEKENRLLKVWLKKLKSCYNSNFQLLLKTGKCTDCNTDKLPE
ncbi:hypothetical protein AJ80_06979 [Polytolypa hystricis UAMH7299]|uniref:Uncharacterized protein n=1 Tax=Polytolypa hystricis (strain UAMH7299) TaxID=1447883 RepID=A0A2B7XST2_POLH7|nr:hypothetical protein AJ80_06979 [Polytolypa hystricis UAMH7299]